MTVISVQVRRLSSAIHFTGGMEPAAAEGVLEDLEEDLEGIAKRKGKRNTAGVGIYG